MKEDVAATLIKIQFDHFKEGCIIGREKSTTQTLLAHDMILYIQVLITKPTIIFLLFQTFFFINFVNTENNVFFFNLAFAITNEFCLKCFVRFIFIYIQNIILEANTNNNNWCLNINLFETGQNVAFHDLLCFIVLSRS